MFNHLPECVASNSWLNWCICNSLRACEQRVRTAMHTAEREEYLNGLYEGRNDGYHRGYVVGYEAGRDAALTLARYAVADHRVPWPTATGDLVNEGIDAALAAIEALRGSGNPDTPPSAERGEQR